MSSFAESTRNYCDSDMGKHTQKKTAVLIKQLVTGLCKIAVHVKGHFSFEVFLFFYQKNKTKKEREIQEAKNKVLKGELEQGDGFIESLLKVEKPAQRNRKRTR